MTARRIISVRRFAREEAGAALIEFGIVVGLFFLLFYSALDFGRLSYTKLMAQRALETAARMAIVRPPACANVPDTHLRGPVPNNTIAPRYGTSCSAASSPCLAEPEVSCSYVGTITCPTAGWSSKPTTQQEIWCRIKPMLPPDAEPSHITYTYTYDSNLGFLGGPYTPVVTVELNAPNFQFISPIGPLMTLFDSNASFPGSIAYGELSVSMPAEDLNDGDNG